MMRRFCVDGVTYARNLFILFSLEHRYEPLRAERAPRAQRLHELREGFDFHLKLRSPALGRGDSDNCPSTDIDGRTRPKKLKCDAGADQRRDTVVCAIGKQSRTVWVSGLWLAERPRPNASPGPCRPTRG